MKQLRVEADNLKHAHFEHGFFTRQNGVSSGIYHSLNCGFGSGDTSENVEKNRAIVLNELDSHGTALITPYQNHTNEVVIAEKGWARDEAPIADAIVTTQSHLAIGILTADCAPLLFIEPEAKIIAAAHAGWRGALNGVSDNVIETMVELGGNAHKICVAIGPSIGVDNYEIGPEFQDNFLAADETNSRFFHQNTETLKHHFNLPGYLVERLKAKGVKSLSGPDHCTYRDESLFFSFRRNFHNSIDDYGRQISAIVIN